MVPAKNNTYVPQMTEQPPTRPIEWVRANGVVVAASTDGTTGVVQYVDGLFVGYVGVTLHPDGTIAEFNRRHTNRYVRITHVGKSNG